MANYNAKSEKKYPPFYQMPVSGHRSTYDKRLRKGDVIANIIGKTIVSLDGGRPVEVDEVIRDLQKLGFSLPA